MQTKEKSRSIRRMAVTALITLAAVIAIALVLIFGVWEKAVPDDQAAAMILIQKLHPDILLSDCQFDSNGELSGCDGLSKKLDLIKGENEQILMTSAGDLVGVNFPSRVVVVLRAKKASDGHIHFSCSVWPQKAAPLGCEG
jgi:hypothetical protein